MKQILHTLFFSFLNHCDNTTGANEMPHFEVFLKEKQFFLPVVVLLLS